MSLLICISLIANAQTIGLNLGIGVAQYYGDLNTYSRGQSFANFFKERFNPRNYRMSYSLGLDYKFKNYISIGIDWSHLYIAGYDSDNKSSKLYDDQFYRLVRNLSFHTTVNQFAIHSYLEPFRTEDKWDEGQGFLSPYLGLGFGIISFDPKAIYQNAEVELQPIGTEGQGLAGYNSKYNLTEWSIPISLGLKYYFPSTNLSIGLGASYSYTNTDYLDDVSGNYADIQDFQNAYSSQTADLVSALSNRNIYGINNPTYGYITKAGEIRGNNQVNDQFVTIQLKFDINLFILFQKNSCPAYD